MSWTLDQALANWSYCFRAGYLSAARAWWSIVCELEGIGGR